MTYLPYLNNFYLGMSTTFCIITLMKLILKHLRRVLKQYHFKQTMLTVVFMLYFTFHVL